MIWYIDIINYVGENMDAEKLFVIHSICESKVFDKLRILIAENVSEIYMV